MNPRIENIESLQRHLEKEFMTKILLVLKHAGLNNNKQYNIAKIFKENYAKKFIELSDDPNLNKHEAISNLRYTFYLADSMIETPQLTYKMIDLVCDEICREITQQIEDHHIANQYFLHDDELNLHNEYY